MFSANLGFLSSDRHLPKAIHAAARAGFDAVERLFPYEVPAQDVRQALQDTGLRLPPPHDLGASRPPELKGSAFGQRRSGARAEDVGRAVDWLTTAERPAIFIGHVRCPRRRRN